MARCEWEFLQDDDMAPLVLDTVNKTAAACAKFGGGSAHIRALNDNGQSLLDIDVCEIPDLGIDVAVAIDRSENGRLLWAMRRRQ